MTSFEKLSVRSSETLRHWLKKLQSFIPVSFTKSNSVPHAGKLLICKSSPSHGVFPSQKNLDVIMDTLRKDMVAILQSSGTNKAVTAILYKLNTLDNNIRETCRFQHTWINHPVSGRESLKTQEKYIVRLIEEIMDDIIEVHSALKRGVKHMSYNERSVNGVISVLAILKREVCNMINITISSIDSKYLSQLKGGISLSLDSNPCTVKQHSYVFNKKNNKSCLPDVKKSTSPISESMVKNTYSENATILTNSKSYPGFSNKKCPIFLSLQNVCAVVSENVVPANHKDSFEISSVNSRECYRNSKEYTADKYLNSNGGKSCLNFKEITNGSGDTDKSCNITIHLPQYLDCEECINSTQETAKTIESYFIYEEKKENDKKNENLSTSRYSNGEEYNRHDINMPTIITKECENKLLEEPSMVGWPSATVVRDIKSDNYLDSYSRQEPSTCRDQYISCCEQGNVSDYVSNDSDSDESYISCDLEDFDLGTCFLNHVKEQFIQRPFEMLIGNNFTFRDKTDTYSCKSAKMSEIITKENKINSSAHCKSDAYHSVESMPCIRLEVDKEIECNIMGLCKEITFIDASVCTDPEKPGKEGGIDETSTISEQRYLDFYNTLALSESNCCQSYCTKSISPAISLTSVSSELVDFSEDRQPSSDKLSTAVDENDVNANLEDSLFSSVCLTKSPSKHNLIGEAGNEFNLMAVEVNT